jgi:hypothetical protein
MVSSKLILSMEFLGTPFFHEDIYRLLFRFGINLLFAFLIIRFLYYRNTQNSTYYFTFQMISNIVFLLCFSLNKYELNLGMALGLFAVFGIIRYRTEAVDPREMTYLFIIIGLALINSLTGNNFSYIELMATNFIVLTSIFFLEKNILKNGREPMSPFTNVTLEKRIVIYNELEHVKAENEDLLKQNLEDLLGRKIEKIQITKINLNEKLATIEVYYLA